MQTLIDNLAQHPFLSGLETPYLYMLEKFVAIEQFEAHRKIFECGDPAEKFYLLNSGIVALQTEFIVGRGVVTIETLGSGEALGWSWLFPPYEWRFGATTLEPVEAITFAAADLRKLMNDNCYFGHALSLRVGGVLLKRLQATRHQLVDMRK